MDDERTLGTTLPRTDEFDRAVPAIRPDSVQAEPDEAARAGVFPSLVRGDGDIIGLVAYSIYKQHKLDWLRAFQTAQGRSPNDAELASYTIGEGTPRRLATYRHLADATLSGQGPHLGPASTGESGRRTALMERPGLSRKLVAVYVLIAIIFTVGIWLALRFTATSR